MNRHNLCDCSGGSFCAVAVLRFEFFLNQTVQDICDGLGFGWCEVPNTCQSNENLVSIIGSSFCFSPTGECPRTCNIAVRSVGSGCICKECIHIISSGFFGVVSSTCRTSFVGRSGSTPIVGNLDNLFCECPSTCEGDNFCVFFRSRIYRIGRCPTGEFPKTFFIAFFCVGSGCTCKVLIHRIFGCGFGVIGGAVCRKGNTFGNTVATIPFVYNLIGCCNRLRLECPSTFVGDGFSYYIIAVIGLDSWIFRPTAESPKTFLFSVICIGGRIAVECSIHRNCSFGLIRISVSRTSLVGRSESTPIIVNFINHGFLFPFCGQGDIFVGGLNCGPFFEEFVLIHPTQEFIILRGGFHLPNSVVT